MTAEEQPEPSRAAGGCVLAALAGSAMAVVFAASTEAGILTTVGAATGAVWWACRRPVSDSSATPPPGEGRPSCSECAGHELLSVAPLEGQKGMLIYKTAPADRPNHTHIHIQHQET